MATALRVIEMTEAEYADSSEANDGACLACGELQGGCEPDARGYECESCGQKKVFGLDELLVMGRLAFKEEGEQE